LKFPICSFDAKTGILCPKCENKLRSGHITKTDVELAVKLAKLSEIIPELDRITLAHALKINGDIVLVVRIGDLMILRSNSAIMKKIEAELKCKVWLVGGGLSDRKLLEDLFYPVRILTVNVVWLPDGSKLTKVIIHGRRRRMPVNIEQIKKIIKEVRGIDLIVEFEK